MFRNYFKVAVRTLMKNKLFTFINIFGLALSMSVCMLVLVNLKEQLAYDSFHAKGRQTYRVISQLTNEQGTDYRFAGTPLPFLDNLEANYNFIDKAARVYVAGTQAVRNADKKQLEVNGAFCDADFFNMFGFPFAEGNAASALDEPNKVVLSKETAKRFFGSNTNPVGQSLEIANWGSFVVSGVLGEAPAKSHLDYDVYYSMNSLATLEKSGKLKPVLSLWDNFNSCYTYIQPKKGVRAEQLSDAVGGVSTRLMRSQQSRGKAALKFEVQRFDKIILGEELLGSAGRTGSRSKVFAEIAIVLIILISACFNYTNLSIARSLYRGKEVGVRKVAGAMRWNLFTQFIMESMLIAFLSFGLAFLFLRVFTDFLPFFNEFMPTGFRFDLGIFLWFLVFTFFTGAIAGIIPAWTLSSFKPVQVLKNLGTLKLFGSNSLRKSLIVVQFVLSLVIVIFTLVFSRQFSYMAKADPLYNRQNIININMQGLDPSLLMNDLQNISGVEELVLASEVPGTNVSGRVNFRMNTSSDPIGVNYYDADNGFIDILGLKLMAGTSFPSFATKGSEQYTIINEQMLGLMKLKSAEEAIGKQILLGDSINVQVVGVIRNFYYQGMEWTPGPLILRNREGAKKTLMVKTRAENAGTMASVEQAWKKLFPYQEFKGGWYLKSANERYAATDTISILAFLAFITITIACLGLLGMVTYVTRTRHKEIGIRKVMGAGEGSLMLMLSKGFLKLVIIAAAIGLPLGYIAGYFFLNIFSNRVSLEIDILLFSVLGILVLVLITISSQIYRVAIANPVEALRSE